MKITASNTQVIQPKVSPINNNNVAEGVVTAPAVTSLAAAHKVETPISDQVTAVLQGKTTVTDAYDILLMREQRSER